MDELKLRELAEAATPGPHHIYTHPRDDNNHAANTAWHSACEPKTVLSLLDELQALRSERTAWRITAENAEAAQSLPDGWVGVPKQMTQAMRDATDADGWTWEDLLAAAEAIAESEYEALAASPAQPKD